jgi:hypothetical protein
MTLPQELIDKQARQFTYYLIKKEPSKLEVDLYKRALTNNKHELSLRDKRIFDFVDRHSWSIGLIDSSMALTDSRSELRRRLLIMFSILECMPERYDQFIPKRRSHWYWFEILFTSLFSILKAVTGSLLIKVID